MSEVLRSAPTLGPEQREMVAHLTTSGNGVDVVLGVAGSGKTHALAVANDAWLRAGLRPRGAALAARAAKELNAQSAIPSQTVDSLLRDLDRGTDELTNRTVLVVDEAGMLGTRTLARLLDCAERVGTKVVLVGDDRQLPEIEAGGAFRGLANRLPTVRLTESRRQTHAVEINALAALRTGRVHDAVAALGEIGGVTIHSSAGDARAAMIERWVSARASGEDAVMLATRRTQVAQLNREARSRLIDAGAIAPHGIEVRGREFSAGDRIVTLTNWHRAGIINGTRGEVVGVTSDSVTVEFDHGERTTLPPTYL
ncbi:MAG: AAA family ATPase, partial [Myxococcota bacterium]